MIALLCFFLTLLVSPFKSKSRLDAEKRCAPRASDPLAGCTIDTLESSFQKRERDDGRQHVIPHASMSCPSPIGTPRIIINRGFIARWTRMPHSTGRLSASASSHHSLFSAAFITNIAESDFRYTQVGTGDARDRRVRVQ